MARFIAYVETSSNGSRIERTFEVPDEELEDLTESERNTVLDDYAQITLEGLWQLGWEES